MNRLPSCSTSVSVNESRIGENFATSSGFTEVHDAVLQGLFQHQREEAARHMTADCPIELVEDWTRLEECSWLCGKHLLHHGGVACSQNMASSGPRSVVLVRHEDAVEPGVLLGTWRGR